MVDFILSTFWGDSASYIASFDRIIPESVSSLIVVLLRDHTSGVFIFNLLILLGFIITFTGSYYVGYKCFKNKFAALFLALVVTFAPIRIRYSMEWAVLTFWGYYIVFFYSVLQYITKQKLKFLLLAGITFCLSFLEQPYIGVILTLVTSSTTLLFLLFYRKKEYFIRTGLLFLALIIFGIPGIYNVYKTRYISELHQSAAFSEATRSEADRWAYSARPWNYFIPDINNPFLGDLAVKANYWIWDHPPYYLTEPFFPKEHTLYLGFTLLTLSLLTLYLTYIKKVEFFAQYKRHTLFVLILTIVAFIFSMPPYIAYNGFYLYFPGELIYQFIPQFRAYARFGAIVFMGVALLATTALAYIYQLDKTYKFRLPLLLLIPLLITIEFATPFFTSRISSQMTEPYQWMTSQQGEFAYLELPRRIDYTDVLYREQHNKRLLNPYLGTTGDIAEIELNITHEIGNSKLLVCHNFSDKLNGKYIMYHEKELYKSQVVRDFQETGIITPQLKIALEESWGEPAWGNHIPKSEEDLAKDAARKNLLNRLENDERFNVAKRFERTPSDQIKNANDLDKVTIFEVNPNYCE